MTNPLFKNGLVDGVFHLCKKTIPNYVTDYITALETGESKEWCKCEWIIHPDDEKVPAGMCRICGWDRASRNHHVDNNDAHSFVGRRMRPGAPDLICPVHTKEGLILGFFEWIADQTEPDKCHECGHLKDAHKKSSNDSLSFCHGDFNTGCDTHCAQYTRYTKSHDQS